MKAAVIAIAIIILAIALYGAFAKTVTTTGANTTSEHDNGFLGFLNGIHLSFA